MTKVEPQRLSIEEAWRRHPVTDLDAEQNIVWLPDRWAQRWSADKLPRPDVVHALIAEWTNHKTLRRSFIAGFVDDPLGLLIASMAWGFGNDARGLYRVGKMIAGSRDGLTAEEFAAQVIDTTRREGAGAGFSALFMAGRPRLPWLGVAFGTKLVHFAGWDAPIDPHPAILDARVHAGAQRIDLPPGVVPNPTRYVSRASYEAYCNWCENTAAALPGALGVEHVEFMLYGLGGGSSA